MHADSTLDRLLRPLRRSLTQPQWQNLVALVVAVQLARTLVLHQLALYLVCVITSASCSRRLRRFLAGEPKRFDTLQRAWVRVVLASFAPGRSRLVLLIDWTWHRDHCRSLWIMLPVGGRAVPLAFWLAPPRLDGPGSQRRFEDQALLQLHQWLPRGRSVLLIGDRGFGGRDRMRFMKRLGFRFLLRINGDTMIWTHEGWQSLRDLAPAVGQRCAWENVTLGKTASRGHVRVNVIAVRQRLLSPKRVRTSKGKLTEATLEETTWFLATDLPLGTDAVALYQTRMQIEETFRDYKALLGLETERVKQPWERLAALLWAMTLGIALDLKLGGVARQQPSRMPRCAKGAREAPEPEIPWYRGESATREGLHEWIVRLVLTETPLIEELRVAAAKSERMKQRPQVRDRRRETPAPKRRHQSQSRIHVHAG
jgi:Transposase DDE domain